MSNAENLKRSEIYMLRDMQRHENLHPGVPYAPGGPGWSAIWDLEKRGLVQQFKPEGHRSGYCLTPDGHIVVEDLPAIPQDSVGSFSAEESKMLRVLQAHGKTQPGVPYHADGQELGVIRDLRKKGLVMYSEPSHPHERYGYVLSGAGMVAVDALTAIQHPEEGRFWTWLDLAYRDGSKGEEPKFTKYNMEVAYRAGTEAARTCSDQRPCVNCFADNGECLGAYPKEAQARATGQAPQPDAWRYRYATDERDARAWSFTDDAGLIERLGEEFEIQPLTVQK